MSNPQQPDPNKPWCRVCRAHTEWTSSVRYGGSSSGTSYKCTKCSRTKMGIPDVWRGSRKIFSCLTFVVLLIAVSILSYIVFWEEPKQTPVWIVALFLGVMMSVTILCSWLSSRWFSAWLKWAQEKNFTEEDYKRSIQAAWDEVNEGFEALDDLRKEKTTKDNNPDNE